MSPIEGHCFSLCFGTFQDGINRATATVMYEGEVYCIAYDMSGILFGVYTGTFCWTKTYPVDILEIAEPYVQDFIDRILQEEGNVG